MPLKLIPPRKEGQSFYVRGTYLGKHVYRSTGARKRAVAVKLLKGIERDIETGKSSERREATFADAALAYMKAGGERTYIKKLLEHFGDTPLQQIDQATIDGAAADLYPQRSAATRNRSVYTP